MGITINGKKCFLLNLFNKEKISQFIEKVIGELETNSLNVYRFGKKLGSL